MDKRLTNLVNQLGNGLSRGLKNGLVNGVSHNRYTLNMDGLPAEVSILQVESNQPWHYGIIF
ncbi:hypothetical protein [Gilliamella apicola]|uniref:hypothetical protein n=1 Tax=Gilliamella apicola TaxID=1196095 RepID=UPI0039875A72